MSWEQSRAGLIAVGLIGLAITIIVPLISDSPYAYTYIISIRYVAMAVFALSLGLIWGFGGILCFGQAAFFGIGGYTYAIAAINFGDTTGAVLLAIIVPALFAAILGYFMFYGRLSDVYLAVITLTVSLILEKLLGSTAGPEYRIGDARLGGFNGIPSAPPLNIPGDITAPLSFEAVFIVAMIILALVYYGSVWLLRTHFGRVIVAIRENELRAELVGYDVRLHKLLVFAVAGGMAGLAGVLFANSGSLVSPKMFSLWMTAQPIIYVIVGGLGTLTGPIIGAVLLQSLIGEVGEQTAVNPNLVMGLVLVLFVLLVPRGIVPGIGRLIQRYRPERTRGRTPAGRRRGRRSRPRRRARETEATDA